ncbi:MAG: DinB family protein [Pyrinomonadaceae bacterium]
MSETSNLIAALAASPGVIVPLIREVPAAIIKRRPGNGKWSAYEHAAHLSQTDAVFRERLKLILSTPNALIGGISNSPEDEAGAMLEVDLEESLIRFIEERASLVQLLSDLSEDEWNKPARHDYFEPYSPFIMFRHLLNHEMLHAYRIEELNFSTDWD